jgi:predicted RNase H-like HicB family nuclease
MDNYNFNFECIIVKEKDGYSAICLDIDVGSDADTVEEAKANLKEAVELYLEDSIESNIPILRPIPNDENPLFTRSKDIIERFNMKIRIDLNIYV